LLWTITRGKENSHGKGVKAAGLYNSAETPIQFTAGWSKKKQKAKSRRYAGGKQHRCASKKDSGEEEVDQFTIAFTFSLLN